MIFTKLAPIVSMSIIGLSSIILYGSGFFDFELAMITIVASGFILNLSKS